MQRLHDCVSNPLMAALAQLDSWLDARTMAAQQPKSSAELAALHGRLKKLRCTVAHLPYQDQRRVVWREVFWGHGLPEIPEQDRLLYRQARCSWIALILASLGAYVEPSTALLLPIVVKSGWVWGA